MRLTLKRLPAVRVATEAREGVRQAEAELTESRRRLAEAREVSARTERDFTTQMLELSHTFGTIQGRAEANREHAEQLAALADADPAPPVTDYLSDILDVLRGIETVLTEIRDDPERTR